MAADPRKRQKKQERRTAKRKAKHHEMVRAKSTGMAERLDDAARFPVLHSWITDAVWEEGIGYVGLSRGLPNNMVAFAVFLVDRHCLGVKDALGGIQGRSEYEERFVRKMRREMPAKDVEPACARKFVEDSVEYARQSGLAPHPDYRKFKGIFGDIDAAACPRIFEFGENGKPLFVAGPYDTPKRCQQVLRALEATRGPGGYHYILPVGPDTLAPGAGIGEADEMDGDQEWLEYDDDEP
jgi:hypothetical protein